MSVYRIILDDGKKIEVRSSSAASAIQSALKAHPFCRVNECYSGMKQEDVDFLRLVDSTARPIVGYIQHEVPDHDPLTENPDPYYGVGGRAAWDKTVPMFDEETILSESQRALDKRAL